MDWDRVVDVVVVGSGGAALVAATLASDQGAEVLIVEKDSMLGGTTAVSGGGIWLPGNHHMAEAGIEDSREAALAYIRRLTDGREPDPELLEVYVDTAPEMLRYLEDHTPVQHFRRRETRHTSTVLFRLLPDLSQHHQRHRCSGRNRRLPR